MKLIQSNQSWISYWKSLMKIQETLYSKNINNWHFLFFLVQQIIVLFLKVSHTHEGADQYLFKDIARKSLPTLPIFRDLAREAYHPMSNVQRLENIWDYKQMLISSKVQLVGHSSPHQLKFVKKGDKVLMHFKEWHLKSTTYQVVDVTSLAAAYQNDLEPIQQIAEKGRKVF